MTASSAIEELKHRLKNNVRIDLFPVRDWVVVEFATEPNAQALSVVYKADKDLFSGSLKESDKSRGQKSFVLMYLNANYELGEVSAAIASDLSEVGMKVTTSTEDT